MGVKNPDIRTETNPFHKFKCLFMFKESCILPRSITRVRCRYEFSPGITPGPRRLQRFKTAYLPKMFHPVAEIGPVWNRDAQGGFRHGGYSSVQGHTHFHSPADQTHTFPGQVFTVRPNHHPSRDPVLRMTEYTCILEGF